MPIKFLCCLFCIALFQPISAETSTTEPFGKTLTRDYHFFKGLPIIFTIDEIEFQLNQDGQINYALPFNAQLHYFNWKYIGRTGNELEYDTTGRITRINNIGIEYQPDGKVKRIGILKVYYDQITGAPVQIGPRKIDYELNKITKHYGNTDPDNFIFIGDWNIYQ
ncbi:hypothetical protein [Robertkochia solimangrovi]|uniref:hypothetical protein n=1 Tax=Robertkochia solimangrovi TaxID=2213046 RepID=UPI00117CDDC9|nr:hypothetical protein [Robertkochia solimangrovi]TRZ45350.1 hypothetical protein DMZ48_06290 [Robertkochia solimangrovi]